jgi:KaiC/GvpD/RAD55 family RecA-like ATPase
MSTVSDALKDAFQKKENDSFPGPDSAEGTKGFPAPIPFSSKQPRSRFEIMPVRVDKFDLLLDDHGIERGLTILVSGGAGTGKTTFAMQSIYYGALAGQKGVYISFEEEPQNIKYHMKKNFGWDFDALEQKGMVAIIKFDPSRIARQVEEVLVKETGLLRITAKEMELPIVPDIIAVDSISALGIEFEDEKNYRKYIKELFHKLQSYNSLNFIISETEQNPRVYSRTGVEEFLVDGVVVFYNLKIAGARKNALEILKLRSGKHVKEMVPYTISSKGFEIFFKQRTF